jgi:hypothetical protein
MDDPAAREEINHHPAPQQEQKTRGHTRPWKCLRRHVNGGLMPVPVPVVMWVVWVVSTAAGPMVMGSLVIVSVLRWLGHGSIGAGVEPRLSRRWPEER